MEWVGERDEPPRRFLLVIAHYGRLRRKGRRLGEGGYKRWRLRKEPARREGADRGIGGGDGRLEMEGSAGEVNFREFIVGGALTTLGQYIAESS